VTEVDQEAGTFGAELWVKKSDNILENGDMGETVTTSGVATFRLPTS
jgi:hypothetical protein